MFAPIPIIRKKYVARKLTKSGAYGPETAKTFKEAHIIHPNWEVNLNDELGAGKVIVKTNDNKYYVKK